MTDDNYDAIVLGGGLAGLTCAVGLARAGVRPLVLERDHIVGGRARSWTDSVTGDPVTIGPHILLSEYPNMLRLLDILGTAHLVVWQQNPFVTMVDGQRQLPMNSSRLPAPLHFIPSLVADRELANRDWLSNSAATLFLLSIGEPELRDLDDQTAIDVLRKYRVSEAYLHRFWEFVCMSIMNVPLEHCSAGALLRFYRRLVGKSNVHVGFPDGGLGDLFADRSIELIRGAGGEVRCGETVSRILSDNGRALGVELADGRRLLARHCIAGLPPHALQAVLPEAWQRLDVFARLNEFQPAPYISVYLWFDQKLTDLRFWARLHQQDDLNLDFYDLSNICSDWQDRPSVIASNIIYSHRAQHLSDELIVQRTVTELAEFLPQAATANVTHHVVNRIPMAIPAPLVGSEALRPRDVTPLPGLILAGDWMQTGLPASMESACLSGWTAAEHVLADLGRPQPLAKPHRELDTSAALLGAGVRLGRKIIGVG